MSLEKRSTLVCMLIHKILYKCSQVSSFFLILGQELLQEERQELSPLPEEDIYGETSPVNVSSI